MFKNPTLTLLYSTYDDSIFKLKNNLPKPHDFVTIIIVHQVIDGKHYDIEFLNRKDIVYYSLLSKGVTKSRNYALSKARSDIVLFCDDDVSYEQSLYERVIYPYRNYSIEACTYIILREGEVMSKYKNINRKSHNKFSILSLGTVEISARLSYVSNNNITFPEDLGAGSHLYLGDEPVFLSRLLDSGGHISFSPVVIGDHPKESSGMAYDERALLSRFKSFQYIFGNLKGLCIHLIYITKNIRKIGFYQYLNNVKSVLTKIV